MLKIGPQFNMLNISEKQIVKSKKIVKSFSNLFFSNPGYSHQNFWVSLSVFFETLPTKFVASEIARNLAELFYNNFLRLLQHFFQ